MDAIRRLQPDLSLHDAVRLERALLRVVRSPSCDVSWPILLSIAFNESSLRKSAVNSGSRDYGLMQINQRMIRRLKLDRARLLRDEEYALGAACHILTANKRQYAAKVPYWLGLYRSGTGLWLKSIRTNAIAYDAMIRRKALEVSGIGLEYARAR